MTMEYFKPNDDTIRDQMLELIANHHPHLAAVDQKIVILFREKAAKKGGEPVLGKTSKINALTNALIEGDEEYIFLLELAHDEWQDLNAKQKVALLDHLLCSLSVEEDEESGDLKCMLVPPDFCGYEEEFRRHGIWRKPSHGAVPGPILDLFGGEGEGT